MQLGGHFELTRHPFPPEASVFIRNYIEKFGNCRTEASIITFLKASKAFWVLVFHAKSPFLSNSVKG